MAMGAYASKEELERIISRMGELLESNERVAAASGGEDFAIGISVTDLNSAFTFRFEGGRVSTEIGEGARPPEIRLSLDSETLDDVFSGRTSPFGAATFGRVALAGDIGLAMGMLSVMDELKKLYTQARAQAQG